MLRHQQQARVRPITQPRIGNVGDQDQPGGARGGLGGEILLELCVGQRPQATEQVELEARHLESRLVLGFDV